MQEKKSKIEAIYPLSFLQQALLFHSLQEGLDQGFLQVQCVLRGRIDLALFQEAWRKNIQRHESLRTSIHWENLEKPVQVVHKEVSLPFTFVDLSASTEHEQNAEFEALKRRDSEAALDLTKTPVLRLFLIKLSEDRHFLMLSCHHILADGWSASIMLKDSITLYSEGNNGGTQTGLQTVPSHKSYLNWISSQDKTKALDFWTEILRGFETPTLIAKPRYGKRVRDDRFETVSLTLSEEASNSLREFSRQNQVTMNTLIQGIWGILLSRYTEQDDVIFGAIVSGRSIDLPNAELMAGMYMNVLPLRVRIDSNECISDWLKTLQLRQSKMRGYEYVSLDETANSITSLSGKPLFDSIVVFENMPLENLSGDEISIESFKSGLTSTYTLTLAVNPLPEIEIHFKYDSSSVSENQINWFSDNLTKLIDKILQRDARSVGDLLKSISSSERITFFNQIEDSDENTKNEFAAPRNAVELRLESIWETLLNRQPIGVTEDFFDLGGTSIIAIRLFTEIEKQFNRKLQPISLLRHRTIRALSELIKDETKDEPWSALVPFRASGSKPPIFCLHAGGGHVFFYKDLAKHLGDDQPVYALQRLDLDPITQAAQNIETTASHFLEEIRKVQPNGSYSLLAYCFSTSICWEIARQLKESGDSVSLMAIIDSPPFRGDKRTTIERINGIIDRARLLDFSFIKTIWQGRIKQPIKVKLISLASGRDAIKQQKLMKTLNTTDQSYIWKPLPVKVTLIRSAAWILNSEQDEMLSKWDDLALSGVDTYVVDGHHVQLFEEPYVKQLAETIKQILDKANK